MLINYRKIKFNKELKRPELTLTIGIVLIFISIFLFFRKTDILIKDLIEIPGTFEKKPSFKHYEIKGANYYDYDIKLKEYSAIFRISDWEYRSLDLNFINNEIKIGDSVLLFILKEDKLLTKSKMNYIKTYGISSTKKKMFDLEIRNRHYREDSRYSIIITIIGIMISWLTFAKNIQFYYAVLISICIFYMFYIFLFIFQS
jgi:hypothetical protein